jgi:DNA-directed RNA polymerase III subunit RPC8
VTLADVVQIHPSEFNKPSTRAIEDYINAKYADKVIHKVGLCVGFHSLISASEGLIGHGTGIVNVNVDFRLVVFRPFKGEIIPGTITHSSVAGIFMSMGFFEDIVAPPEFLFDDTKWERDEDGNQLFIWRADNGEGGFNEFFFDRAEKCMMRVEVEEWNDLSPQMKRPEDYDLESKDKYGLRLAPYRILCSMMHSGLGPTLWWLGEEAGEGEAMEVDGGAENGT